MNERLLSTSYFIAGTTTGNHVITDEFPFPVVYLGSKATAANDSDAKLAVSGGATVTAAVIGDSGDPAYLQPSAPTEVAVNTAIVFTLDYDGTGGTAAQGVSIQNFYLVGES
jgi:hypothetical protein